MNWYKQTQTLEVLNNNDIDGKGRHYTDYGHDIYYEEQNKLLDIVNNKYNEKEPNLMWIFRNGEIKVKEETDDCLTHRNENAWGLDISLDKLYTGRFSPSEKTISVIAPYGGIRAYKDIPNFLQTLLRKTFPTAERIIRY